MSELKACPFCKCTEIVAGKDYTRGNYRADCLGCSAFITAPSLKLAIQYWNTRPIEDGLRAELARRDEIIKRLKEDGERLASGYEQVSREAVPYCVVCKKDAFSGYSGQIKHDDWCPITLHRALMKEIGG